MKKPNITEGEWYYEDSILGVHSNKVPRKEFKIEQGRICRLGYDNNTSDIKKREFIKANAQAISAVPEMIDALIEAKETLEYIKSFQTGHVCNSDIEQIESALKKAGVQL